MKNTTSLILFMLSLASIIYLQSCKKKEPCQDPRNSECENYNPCIDVQETSAKFTIEEIVPLLSFDSYDYFVPNHNLRNEADTVKTYNETIFTCQQKTDSIWWIFDDTEMRPLWQQKKSITIRFGNTGNPEKTPIRVKITCIVKNNKPNTCFFNDNGKDTFTRYVVYMPVYQTGFTGKFRGSLSSNPDSIFNLNVKFDSLFGENNYLRAITIRFDELLSEPPYPPNPQFGSEYGTIGSDYGYNSAYLFFNSFSGADGVNPAYKGKTIKGIVYYNGTTNTLKVDFIRHGKGVYGLTEWPPKNIPLLTFIGQKIK
jgi:hypothetical protein